MEALDELVELLAFRLRCDAQVLLGELHLVRLTELLLEVGELGAEGLHLFVLFGCWFCKVRQEQATSAKNCAGGVTMNIWLGGPSLITQLTSEPRNARLALDALVHQGGIDALGRED